MKASQVSSAALAVLLAACANAQPRQKDAPRSKNLLSLDFTNNGQHLIAHVGEAIVLTLGTVGPQQYDQPQLSSPAIRFVNKKLKWPVTPGGPAFTYTFRAVTAGVAQVRFQ